MTEQEAVIALNMISGIGSQRLKKLLEACGSASKVLLASGEKLRKIYDPPICLYLKGKLSQEDTLSLAIVGSRRASFYGLSCAEKFAFALAELGISIVSGLARGIDTQAHK